MSFLAIGYQRNEHKALGVVKSEAVVVSKIFKLELPPFRGRLRACSQSRALEVHDS